MSECFATIFWRVLCEWSCGSLIAFFSRNWHSFPDGNHYFRALSLLALFLQSTCSLKGVWSEIFVRIFASEFLRPSFESIVSMESW